jgi:hypothetical protein
MSEASLAFATSKGIGVPVETGDAFADGFMSLGMVDAANATGLDTSEAGYLKPAGGNAADPVLFGTAASGTYASGYTVIDITTPLTPGDVITHVGFNHTGAVSATVKIAKRNSAGNFDFVVSESFSHPGGGLEYKTLSSAYTVPLTGSYYPAVYNGTDTIRAAAGSRASKSGNATGSAQSGFTESSSANMVPMAVQKSVVSTVEALEVCSEIISVPFVPEAISGELWIVPDDALTLNSDIMLDVTRDGSTWNQVTLEEYRVSGGTWVLRFDAVDLSSDPSDDQPRWRLRSDPLDPKMFRARGISMAFTE